MNLNEPPKDEMDVNLKIMLILIFRCTLCFFFIAMLGCFVGGLIVFFKTNGLVFDWGKDVFYSLKIGVFVGPLAGLGIWVKAKIYERKNKMK